MDIFTLASGASYRCDLFATIPSPRRVYINIIGEPLMDVVRVFSNPEETKMITYIDNCIYGFTRLASIVPGDNSVRVCLAPDE